MMKPSSVPNIRGVGHMADLTRPSTVLFHVEVKMENPSLRLAPLSVVAIQ